jgi:protein-S-isoprenylcysteine O-methyltransferase Ste14
MIRRLARLRVPLGFLAGAVALWLARPTSMSIAIGGAIAVPGELLRVWAAGHLTRWREVTRSGPYRFMSHPLYVGSSIMAVGFAVAAANPAVAALVAIYMVATLTAAVRFEARELHAQFGAEYTAYQQGRAAAVTRGFSLARVVANREYRAAAGLAIGLALLWLRKLSFPQ